MTPGEVVLYYQATLYLAIDAPACEVLTVIADIDAENFYDQLYLPVLTRGQQGTAIARCCSRAQLAAKQPARLSRKLVCAGQAAFCRKRRASIIV